ncbi:MAG TPA: PEP-CTERM sorting domain-containing protein [Phycisphaerae bacterium]|nr:PEP-CTERM sorting domain-containing protein [Phycisphaerae bacterium]
MKYIVLSLVASLACAHAARAAIYSYVNWTAATAGTPGSASGVIHTSGGDVNVSYAGELNFAQLNNSGTKYWSPATTWTSGVVTNAAATSDMIALGNNGANYTGTDSIQFSAPVTNPILSIVSLGGFGTTVQWTFSAPFVLLSQGPSTAWGGTATSLSQPQPNILQGQEGNGTIEFVGTFTSLSFTQSTSFNEHWHSFTVGIPESVPEPAAVTILGVGAMALLWRRR